MRRVCYISGTRADFGLMRRTLMLANDAAELSVAVCVTGMHLSPTYGNTVSEIEATGLQICGRVAVDVDSCSGAAMAIAMGNQVIEFTRILSSERPDFVLLLGDRAEMLAGALAAIHLNTPIVHIHGGERSGTVDEPIRHAISKLAHYHLVATTGARERLVRMGERPDTIFVTGAPGLDDLKAIRPRSREALCHEVGFDPQRPIGLVLFHPVLQQELDAGIQASEVINAALEEGLQLLCLRPNSDAGAVAVRGVVEEYSTRPGVAVMTHLTRDAFVSWMAAADVMIGNSSSGIIEAATVGLPVVNVGSRQNLREQSGNVVNVPDVCRDSIAEAITKCLKEGRSTCANVYGDGAASERIVALLSNLPASPALLTKSNAY